MIKYRKSAALLLAGAFLLPPSGDLPLSLNHSAYAAAQTPQGSSVIFPRFSIKKY